MYEIIDKSMTMLPEIVFSNEPIFDSPKNKHITHNNNAVSKDASGIFAVLNKFFMACTPTSLYTL